MSRGLRQLLPVLAAAVTAACAEPAPTCELGLDLDAEACATVRGLARPAAPPPARGNAVADDEDAARLGFYVFFDARFSPRGIRCATCHEPERAFGDERPTALGVAAVPRNSPTVLDVAWQRWAFWDGRADSLWSQPLVALEAEAEMATTRLAVAHRLARSYRAAYERVFGPLPPLEDAARFPADGKPGDPAYDAMAEADRAAIDRVFANVGKALEAYERKLVTGPSRLDRFLAGEADALEATERRGLEVFVTAGCAGCHAGPTLSDGDFHNLGLADDPGDPRGRSHAIELLAASPFSAAGPHHDGPVPPDFPPLARPADLGAFRTAPLRNVTRTAPYGHDGRWATLGEAIDFHLRGGDPPAVGAIDPGLVPLTLAPADRAALEAFLAALSGTPPPLPWSDWPNGG